jgi:hypothetical protein
VRRFRATNVDGRLRARVVTGAGVLRYQNNDTTRTRRHPRPFRPYSQEHARVLRVRAHPRAGAGATRTRLLPCHTVTHMRRLQYLGDLIAVILK